MSRLAAEACSDFACALQFAAASWFGVVCDPRRRDDWLLRRAKPAAAAERAASCVSLVCLCFCLEILTRGCDECSGTRSQSQAPAANLSAASGAATKPAGPPALSAQTAAAPFAANASSSFSSSSPAAAAPNPSPSASSSSSSSPSTALASAKQPESPHDQVSPRAMLSSIE